MTSGYSGDRYRIPRPGASITALVACVALAVFVAVPARGETLEDAWKAALATDARLDATRRQTRSAEESLSAARGERWPGLSLSTGYTALDNAPAFRFELPGAPSGAAQLETPFAEDRFGTVDAMASLPLFTSGKIRRAIDAARSGVSAAVADEARAALDIKVEVAESYVGILRARRALAVAESHVASLEAHATDATNRYDQGLVAKNDWLASKVSLADARQQVIRERNRLEVASAVYNRLLGRPLEAAVEIDEIEPKPVEGTLESLVRAAREHRPELRGLAEQVESLRAEAASVHARALPQISLTGGYLYLDDPFLVHDQIWMGTVGLRWSIFDGGVIRHQAGAVLEKASSVSSLRRDLESRIALEVRSRWLDLDETRRRMGVAKQAIDQAEENLRVTTDRYQGGLATNTEVLDAETLRSRAHRNYDDAVYDAVVATIRLRRAIGEL